MPFSMHYYLWKAGKHSRTSSKSLTPSVLWFPKKKQA